MNCSYCDRPMVPEQKVVKRPVPHGAKDLGLTDRVWVAKCEECGQEIPYDDRAAADDHLAYELQKLFEQHGLLTEAAYWCERHVEVTKRVGDGSVAGHFARAARAEMEKGRLATARELCSRAIQWHENHMLFARMHFVKARADGIMTDSDVRDLAAIMENTLVEYRALANEIARQEGEPEPYDL